MGLRAKKPKITDKHRLKALVYAGAGVGKTHFCCSFPDAYYIDTEGLEDFPQFVKMLHDRNSDLVYLTELTDIISEVKELISVKHNYKTLIIDSISFPYGWLSQMEAERLQRKSPNTEGTEFGANIAKAKRLTYQLGILLSMLDMNVVVVSHEKVKYSEGEEVGKTYDITDKMAYALGSVWHLRLQGKNRKLFIEKSRYSELKTNESMEFDDGYITIKNLFGEDIFTRESKIIELASNDQIIQFNKLSKLFNITDEQIQVRLRSEKAESLESVSKETMDKWINKLNQKINGDQS